MVDQPFQYVSAVRDPGLFIRAYKQRNQSRLRTLVGENASPRRSISPDRTQSVYWNGGQSTTYQRSQHTGGNSFMFPLDSVTQTQTTRGALTDRGFHSPQQSKVIQESQQHQQLNSPFKMRQDIQQLK